jgi:hypothetical protein
LFGYRLARCSDTEEWAIDTEEAVAAARHPHPKWAPGLIPAELVAELAASAKQVPLVHPAIADPGYSPRKRWRILCAAGI